MGNRAKNQRNTHKRTIRTQQRFGKNVVKARFGGKLSANDIIVWDSLGSLFSKAKVEYYT